MREASQTSRVLSVPLFLQTGVSFHLRLLGTVEMMLQPHTTPLPNGNTGPAHRQQTCHFLRCTVWLETIRSSLESWWSFPRCVRKFQNGSFKLFDCQRCPHSKLEDDETLCKSPRSAHLERDRGSLLATLPWQWLVARQATILSMLLCDSLPLLVERLNDLHAVSWTERCRCFPKVPRIFQHSFWQDTWVGAFLTTNNSSPNHDGCRELVFFQKQILAPLCPPLHWTVGWSCKPWLIREEGVGPVFILVGNTKRQPVLNMTICQARSVTKGPVWVFQVVPDSIDRCLACSKDAGKVWIWNGTVFSSVGVHQHNQSSITSDAVDLSSATYVEWFFSSIAFRTRLMSSAPTLNRLFNSAIGIRPCGFRVWKKYSGSTFLT